MDLVCGFFLQVTPLPTGNSGFCCFEVRLLYSDQQRAEQVVELADSLVQLITVFRDQPFKKIIIFNKGTGEKLNVALLYFWGGGLVVKLFLVNQTDYVTSSLITLNYSTAYLFTL